MNPATLENVGEAPASSPKDVVAAVAASRVAQREWAARSFDERLDVLRAIKREVLAGKEALARIIAQEMGKPLPECLTHDILPVLDAVKYLERDGKRVLGGESYRLSNPLVIDRKSRISYEPRGVVGIIAPWNYPVGIPGSQTCYALFAGNGVVLKPASYTVLSALKLRDLCVRAGLPADLFQVVAGPGSTTGKALVESDVDYLIFTGSVPVGHAVQADCARRGVPTCMELGGSDPAIVLEDARLDVAANGILWGRFTNGGQTCAAVKRVFAVEAVAKELQERVAEGARRLRLGNPLAPGVDVGPLIDAKAVQEMEEFVEDAVRRGARVLAGGKRWTGLPGHFFEPTVLADVPPEARCLREEVFGPILPIVAVRDEEEAIRRANDSDFGLTASVWTADASRGERVAARLEAGTVTVNDAVYTFAANETPWGGVKDSGHGRTHGPWGLLEMVHLKHVNVAPAGRMLPQLWWFPYQDGSFNTLLNGLDFLYGGVGAKLREGPGVTRQMLKKRNL